MNEATSTGAVVATSKGLWAAVGVLGLAVVGLGGALYSTLQPKTAAEVATAARALPELAAPGAPGAEPASAAKPRPASVKKAQAPSEVAPRPAARPAPVCADCATVATVTPFEREVATSGAGAVAGAVAGAIVGNQVGRGTGRDVARVIGIIGGGIAGNQVEKNMKKVQAYRVELRMDDGRRQTLEVDSPVTVGERVRVDGKLLQPLAH